jgi:hypothetical protein
MPLIPFSLMMLLQTKALTLGLMVTPLTFRLTLELPCKLVPLPKLASTLPLWLVPLREIWLLFAFPEELEKKMVALPLMVSPPDTSLEINSSLRAKLLLMRTESTRWRMLVSPKIPKLKKKFPDAWVTVVLSP